MLCSLSMNSYSPWQLPDKGSHGDSAWLRAWPGTAAIMHGLSDFSVLAGTPLIRVRFDRELSLLFSRVSVVWHLLSWEARRVWFCRVAVTQHEP